MDLKKLMTNNQKFNGATKAEKRVIIAKDVLKQLKAKKIKAERFTYLDENFTTDYAEEDMREALNKTEEPCSACGVGSLCIALVLRENDFKVPCGINVLGAILKKLTKYFSMKQLALIETAFEGKTRDIHDMVEEKLPLSIIYRAETFTRGCFTVEEMLIKIMKNIIKNEGTFKP